MSFGACYTVVMPSRIHLGAFLRQSDAEHLPNVSFLMIVEASPSDPPRYRANRPDLFFKARHELVPGTILYADLSALFQFLDWTPEAARNADDHSWNQLFPDVAPGVYILEAGCVSAGPSGPACSVPEDRSSAMESVVLDNRDAQDSSASLGVTSLVGSPPRTFPIPLSEFLVEDSNSTAAGVGVQPSRLAVAQAFLNSREDRSKTEVAAIIAARAGQVPSRGSREGNYMVIPLPGSIHRDWMAMISFLVTELEVSGRAVSDDDLRHLRKWAHNYGAVQRRAASSSSDVVVSQSARGAKKRALAAAVEPDRARVVPARRRREPRFFDPHGPPTEGDFASAALRVAAVGIDEDGSTAGGTTSSRLDVPGPVDEAAILSTSNIPIVVAPTDGGFALVGGRNAISDFGEATSSVGSLAVPRMAVTVAPIAVDSTSAGAPIVRADRAAPFQRNSEVGRSAILQAETVLAAALRELDSARASIVDCTAAVAIARRHLGLGGFGDDQDA